MRTRTCCLCHACRCVWSQDVCGSFMDLSELLCMSCSDAKRCPQFDCAGTPLTGSGYLFDTIPSGAWRLHPTSREVYHPVPTSCVKSWTGVFTCDTRIAPIEPCTDGSTLQSCHPQFFRSYLNTLTVASFLYQALPLGLCPVSVLPRGPEADACSKMV